MEEFQDDILLIDCQGSRGTDGLDGLPGKDDSHSPHIDGKDGTSGTNGQNASNVTIALKKSEELEHVIIDVLEFPDLSCRKRFSELKGIVVLARGGTGGDGGCGGRGGIGIAGKKGADASKSARARDGGRGMKGGNGGNAGHGGHGGDGGRVEIRVRENETDLLTLLMTHLPNVSGGKRGKEGRVGRGGGGGQGGKGGAHCFWSETQFRGKMVTTVAQKSHPEGKYGPSGENGDDGDESQPGSHGKEGELKIIVGEGENAKQYQNLFDLRVENVRIEAVDDGDEGPYGLGDVLQMSLNIKNYGEMKVPPGFLYSVHRSIAIELAQECTVSLPEIAPLETFSCPPIQFQVNPKLSPLEHKNPILVYHKIFNPQIGDDILANVSQAPAEFNVEFAIDFVAHHPKTVCVGEEAPFSVVVRYKGPKMKAGEEEKVKKKKITVGIFVPFFKGSPNIAGEFEPEDFVLRDSSGNVMKSLYFEIEIARGTKRVVTGTISCVNEKIKPFHSFEVQVALFSVQPSAGLILVQKDPFFIQIGEYYKYNENSHYLLLTNHHTTLEEVEAWENLVSTLGGQLSIWSFPLHREFSLSTPLPHGNSLRQDFASQTIILLNNSFKAFRLEDGTLISQPFDYIDVDEILEAVRDYGVSFFVVGKKIENFGLEFVPRTENDKPFILFRKPARLLKRLKREVTKRMFVCPMDMDLFGPVYMNDQIRWIGISQSESLFLIFKSPRDKVSNQLYLLFAQTKVELKEPETFEITTPFFVQSFRVPPEMIPAWNEFDSMKNFTLKTSVWISRIRAASSLPFTTFESASNFLTNLASEVAGSVTSLTQSDEVEEKEKEKEKEEEEEDHSRYSHSTSELPDPPSIRPISPPSKTPASQTRVRRVGKEKKDNSFLNMLSGRKDHDKQKRRKSVGFAAPNKKDNGETKQPNSARGGGSKDQIAKASTPPPQSSSSSSSGVRPSSPSSPLSPILRPSSPLSSSASPPRAALLLPSSPFGAWEGVGCEVFPLEQSSKFRLEVTVGSRVGSADCKKQIHETALNLLKECHMARPDTRMIIVCRLDPTPLASKFRLGFLDIHRSLDPTATQIVCYHPLKKKSIHRASFVFSPATQYHFIKSLSFVNKLALLDHTAETFSKTNPTFSDEIPFIHFHEPEHIFSVIVCGIVSDIAVELRKYYYQHSGVGFETPHQQFCLQDLLEYRFVNAGSDVLVGAGVEILFHVQKMVRGGILAHLPAIKKTFVSKRIGKFMIFLSRKLISHSDERSDLLLNNFKRRVLDIFGKKSKETLERYVHFSPLSDENVATLDTEVDVKRCYERLKAYQTILQQRRTPNIQLQKPSLKDPEERKSLISSSFSFVKSKVGDVLVQPSGEVPIAILESWTDS